MRARFFGAEASTAHTTERLERDARRRVPLAGARHPRRRRHRPRCSPRTPASIELVIHTAAQPSHDWAASDPQTDFAVNANGTLNLLEATRRHAPVGDVHLLLDQQGLRRPAQRRCRWSSSTSGSSCPPDHRYLRRHRHVDVDRRVDALAVRRLQGRRRPARAGVRPLLRHADRLLPRRLPDRAQPRRARSCTASSPT